MAATFFSVLVVWHSNVLLLPPYADQAIGLWTEADYLARTSFDYYSLRYKENHLMSADPGPRSYMISILPTLLAVLMTVSPNFETVTVVTHLFSFACGAVIATLIAAMLRPSVGLPLALMSSIAMITVPMFNAQLMLAGMEIPLTLAAMVSVFLLGRHRYTAAALVAGLAFLCKATGALMTFGGICTLVALLFLGGKRLGSRQRAGLRWGLAAYSIVLLLEIILIAVGDTSVSIRSRIDWPEAVGIRAAIYWAPDVLVLTTLALLGTLFAASTQLATAWRHIDARSSRSRLREAAYQVVSLHVSVLYSVLLIIGLSISCWLYIFIPRYITCGIPFVFLTLGYAIASLPRSARMLAMLLVVSLTGFNLMNTNGAFFPDIEASAASTFSKFPQWHARACPFAERSSEYLADHLANIEAIRRLEQDFGDHPVLAPLPQRFFLTMPSLGYVSRTMRTYNADDFTASLEAFRRTMLPDSEGNLPKAPVFVWRGRSRAILPPPESTDHFIYTDSARPPLKIYLKNWPTNRPRTSEELTRWYLEQTWPGPWIGERFDSRFEYLARTGDLERARSELQYALEQAPKDKRLLELQDELARMPRRSADEK